MNIPSYNHKKFHRAISSQPYGALYAIDTLKILALKKHCVNDVTILSQNNFLQSKDNSFLKLGNVAFENSK